MALTYPLYSLASTYGCSAYGSQAYSTSTACGATTTTSSSSNGSLTNTGTAVLTVVVIACALIIVGVLIRFWRKRGAKDKNNTAAQ